MVKKNKIKKVKKKIKKVKKVKVKVKAKAFIQKSEKPIIYKTKAFKASEVKIKKIATQPTEKKDYNIKDYVVYAKHGVGKIISVEGKIKGKISNKILGNKGFGYDSIFIPDAKKITFGQMPKLTKIKTDHRFIAFKKLRKKIKIL